MASTNRDGLDPNDIDPYDPSPSWQEDRESYLPDDDPFAEQGLVGDPLGSSEYELVYRIFETPGGQPCLSVAGYRGAPVHLDIPEVWDGMPVTRIDPSAFECCETLVTASMSSSILSIDEKAFLGCSKLRDVDLSWSLDVIASDLFAYCESLESVTIPDRVSHIYDSAFYGCLALEWVDLPYSVESIGDHAFFGCTSLRSIDLSYVDEISTWAFSCCTSLEDARICSDYPATRELNIDAWAFDGCTSLKSVWIERPEFIEIGNSAFAECTTLEKVTISGGIEELPERAFFGCTSLATAEISHDLQIIREEAFAGCTSLVALNTFSCYPYKNDPSLMCPFDLRALEIHEGAFNSCPLPL